MEIIIKNATDRFQLWEGFIKTMGCDKIGEIGVYRGEFAAFILEKCPLITDYFMIDPWRNLNDWNKPANKDDKVFEDFYCETIAKTEFAKDKRHVLRGTTSETIDSISDNYLDFVYIDGDHTLRGITIDLLRIWNKLTPGGYIAGDDFCSSIWQHSEEFEPTLVFPFAVYFAEAMNRKIYALPFNQFLISKGKVGFELIDFTNGKYPNKDLKTLISKPVHRKATSSKKRLVKKIKSMFK